MLLLQFFLNNADRDYLINDRYIIISLNKILILLTLMMKFRRLTVTLCEMIFSYSNRRVFTPNFQG